MNGNDRTADDRAVCGSRCCAHRRWRYRCSCAMDTRFVDKNAVCAFTQALAVNKRIRRGTGQLPAVVRGSWTDTSMRRSHLICVCSGTNLRRLAHLQPGFVCMCMADSCAVSMATVMLQWLVNSEAPPLRRDVQYLASKSVTWFRSSRIRL